MTSLDIDTERINWELNVVLTSVILAFVLSASFERHILKATQPLTGVQSLLLVTSYLLIIWSQINYLQSVASKPYRTPLRFFPDILILFCYGYLTWHVTDYRAIELSIAGVFFSFLVWDVLKLYEWWDHYEPRDTYRAGISLVLLVVSVLVLLDPLAGLLFFAPVPIWTDAFGQIGLLFLFWLLKSERGGTLIETKIDAALDGT